MRPSWSDYYFRKIIVCVRLDKIELLAETLRHQRSQEDTPIHTFAATLEKLVHRTHYRIEVSEASKMN